MMDLFNEVDAVALAFLSLCTAIPLVLLTQLCCVDHANTGRCPMISFDVSLPAYQRRDETLYQVHERW